MTKINVTNIRLDGTAVSATLHSWAAAAMWMNDQLSCPGAPSSLMTASAGSNLEIHSRADVTGLAAQAQALADMGAEQLAVKHFGAAIVLHDIRK